MSQEQAGRIPEFVYEHALKPAAVAIFFVLLALIWTFPLQHWMGYPFVFLFLAAIMGSAWFGGRVAGFIAVVLSSLLVTYLFIPPFYSISVAHESESFLVAFICFALTMSILSSARKKSESEVRAARDLLEVKVQERTWELERSNREIQQSERQLRMLTEAIPQQIWRAAADGRVEYFNQHLRDYLGLPEGIATDGQLLAAIHPYDAPQVEQAWHEALASGEALEVEARVRGNRGDYRWFLIRAFPQQSGAGEIARWYGLHVDIEEHRREQQSLTARQESLSELSRSLSMSEVAASIAHELNQPMTALVTHAYACREWAAADPPNLEKVSATAEKIVQEGTRASAVVKRVRSLFSNDELVRTRCDINKLIEDSARLMREDEIREGIHIELKLGAALPETEVDAVQIQQVILNLVKNAMEAMAHGGVTRMVTIESGRSATREIYVRVLDTGPGIDPAAARQLFEPFFSTKKSGTGIGLAICRSILEAHNGHITAASGVNGGAVFEFSLPVTA